MHAKVIVDKVPHAILVWRTSPYNLHSFDMTQLANSVQRMVCCAAGIRVIPWDCVTSNATKSDNGLVSGDRVHYRTYEEFWLLYQQGGDATSIGQSPCGKFMM